MQQNSSNNTNAELEPESTSLLKVDAAVAIQLLKRSAQAQLNQILGQEKKIEKFQSNLDLVLKRYQLTESYLSYAAGWYGRQALWSKLGIGVLIVGSAALLGMIVNMVAIVTIVSATIYVTAAFLLVNHHNASQEKDRHLGEGVADMEKDLRETTLSLRELEDKLNAVFISLCTQNTALADETGTLHEQTASLALEISNYKRVVTTLEETNRNLLLDQKILEDVMTSLKKELKLAETSLLEKTGIISELSIQLEQTNAGLQASKTALAEIEEGYQLHLSSLSALVTSLSEQLTLLNTQMARNAQIKKQLESNFSKEVYEKAEQLLARADSTLTNAASLREEFDACFGEEPNQEVEKTALLARVANALATTSGDKIGYKM